MWAGPACEKAEVQNPERAAAASPDSPGAAPAPAAAPNAPDEDPPETSAWAYVDDPADLGVDPGLAAKARVIWDTRCAHCHGIHGGEGGRKDAFDPKPANFQSETWQEKSHDDHIRRVVLEGGKKYGLSEAMGANLDLREHPEVMDALVELLRGFPYWSGAVPVPKNGEAQSP